MYFIYLSEKTASHYFTVNRSHITAIKKNIDCQKCLESVSSLCASYTYTTTPEVPFVRLFPHAFSLQVHLIFFRCFLSLLVDERADVVEVPLLDGQHVGSEAKFYFQGKHPPSSSYASLSLVRFHFYSLCLLRR